MHPRSARAACISLCIEQAWKEKANGRRSSRRGTLGHRRQSRPRRVTSLERTTNSQLSNRGSRNTANLDFSQSLGHHADGDETNTGTDLSIGGRNVNPVENDDLGNGAAGRLVARRSRFTWGGGQMKDRTRLGSGVACRENYRPRPIMDSRVKINHDALHSLV